MTHSEDTIFVGREEELTQLMTFAKDAFAGKAGVAFVTGEAGIGKTFLVEEFFRQLQKEYEDVVIASGQCTIQSASYLPLRSLLENLLTSQKEIMAEIIGKVGVELLGVFGISGKTVQKPSDGDTTRLIQQWEELQHQWDLLSKQLSLLEDEKILETRSEEKFRLEHKIEKIKTEREQIGNALSNLERQLPHQTHIDLSETPVPKDLSPVQIFGWYTKVMQDVSSFFPLVLFIDDLQWADDSSLNLLFHLGRELKGQRMLVIETYRPHEVAQNSLLMKVKAELGRYGAKEFCLDVSEDKPKDIKKTKHFVHEYLMTKYGTHFSDTFEQVLVDRTEGNALFLTEILKNLEEKGQIAQKVDATSQVVPTLTTAIEHLEDLPEKVENAVSERVDRLETALREILDYASVEGDNFIAQVIAKVRQIQERSLINDLTKKLMKTYQLIWERGGKSLPNGQRIHEFSFKHNLIREYVYAQLSETDKEFIHAEIGECLERLYKQNTDEIASQLAVHFFHGHVLDKAMLYCLKAAEDANQRYGASEAVRFGKMGLEALEKQVNILSREEYAENKMRFFLELSIAEGVGGIKHEKKDHIQAGILYLNDNLSMLDNLSNELCAKVYAQLGGLYAKKSATKQEAKEFFEKALTIYEQDDDKANIAEILYHLGDVYGYISDLAREESPFEKAVAAFRRSLKIAKSLNNVKLQVLCLCRLAWKYNVRKHSYAEECASQALQLSRSSTLTDKYLEMRTLDAMAVINQGYFKDNTAVRHYQESLEIAKQIGDILFESHLLHQQAYLYHFHITLQPQAQVLLEVSLAIRDRIGVTTNFSFSVLGRIFTEQGKWEQAEEYYKKAIIQSNELSNSLYRFRIGRLHMFRGNYEQAEQEFLYRIQIMKKYNKPLGIVECAEIALNYALLEEQKQCGAFIKITKTLLEKEVYPKYKWEYLYKIAEVYRILHEFEVTKTLCDKSISSYLKYAEDAEGLFYLAEARLVMGKILVDMGEYQEAITYLDKAKAAFEIYGHYALGETLLYLGKAHQGFGGTVFLTQAKEFVNKALAEFQRLELHHKEREAREVLEKLI